MRIQTKLATATAVGALLFTGVPAATAADAVAPEAPAAAPACHAPVLKTSH
ncbi:hypothetical protein [Rothia terrae]|uniref:Uncharacterized protein n=1 Tax=Rothia terrae TaxID=396015 RepID=A0A7H2BE71_9MICC|nr:hypothetical protein [Rothia terrae]QNV37967.1 hypothetical protein IDM49_01320 [Rothia terrae]